MVLYICNPFLQQQKNMIFGAFSLLGHLFLVSRVKRHQNYRKNAIFKNWRYNCPKMETMTQMSTQPFLWFWQLFDILVHPSVYPGVLRALVEKSYFWRALLKVPLEKKNSQKPFLRNKIENLNFWAVFETFYQNDI